jgi:phosphatidylserine/phosphatidylglycerophosphate/cardiolipin synthase-like enzyme
VKLIIQPDSGLSPILKAIKRARKSINIVIFRFDREETERALASAVARGVPVRALVAHTNQGGAKELRKLEQRLLEAGVTVSRTADDLPRYHAKMIIIDDVLYVLGFNFTRQDIEKSRSFGVITRETRLVREALSLFEADALRQPYTPGHDRLVVSPETSRQVLTDFLRGAKRELLIYDERLNDKLMERLLRDRVAAGVAIRVLGKTGKGLAAVFSRRLPDLRLHARAIIRDGTHAFIGSQSLRKLELDGRREVGVIIHDSRIARKMRAVFEADWSEAAPDKKKAEKKEIKKVLKAAEAVARPGRLPRLRAALGA